MAVPPASQIRLTGASKPTNDAFFGVLAATNPALPLSNWASLTGRTEVSSGQFQFADPQATTNKQRFYRVRSP